MEEWQSGYILIKGERHLFHPWNRYAWVLLVGREGVTLWEERQLFNLLRKNE